MLNSFSKGVVAVCCVVFAVVIAGVILGIGSWKLGWFVQNKNLQQQIQYTKHEKGLIDQQAKNNQDNSGAQQGYLQQFGNLLTAIQGAFSPGQAVSDAQQACEVGSMLDPSAVSVPQYDLTWIKSNCNGNALSPSSQYAK